MKINSIRAYNFLGIKEVYIDFRKTSGLTLIEGINKDTSTAGSNGAGKSSIFEAMLWGLYGATKRGLTGDSIINRHNINAGSFVHITLSSNKTEYSIFRTRKYRDHGTGLKITANTEDITKGTIKDTQTLIEDIIKISKTVFEKAVYFGQEDIKSFANLTDRELKQVFEEALGLIIFSTGEQKTKQYITDLENQKTLIQHQIETKEKETELIKKDINTTKEKIKITKTITEKHIQYLTNELKKLQTEHKNLTQTKKTQPEQQNTENINHKLQQLSTLHNKLMEQYSTAHDQYIENQTKTNQQIQELQNIKKEQQNIDRLTGTKCTKCGRQYKKQDIENRIKIIETDIKNKTIQISEQKQILQKQKQHQDNLEKLAQPLIQKTETIKQQLSEIKNKEIQIKKIQTEINIKTEEKQKIKLNMQQAVSDLSRSEIKLEADLNTALSSWQNLLNTTQQIHSKLETAYMLADILGNQGAKSYVFDSVTPELNKAVSRNMNILDPDISIELSTITKLKSGGLREKFEINIENKNGAKEYKGSSGGEKSKINIAISLAFNELMRTMNSDIGICFFDEPFENLDSESSEAVVDLLSTINAHNIFITSHNQAIKDLISNKIKIIKKNGLASLE